VAADGCLHALARCDAEHAPRAAEALSCLLALERGAWQRASGAGAAPLAQRANRRGETPLVAFAAARMTACCELLLEADGRPDEEREADAFHALRGAASQGHLPTVRSLLAHGAHPARSIGGEGTAIHAAATGGHVDVLHVLLDWVRRDDSDRASRDDASLEVRPRRAGSLQDALRTTDAEWKSEACSRGR